jgi:signal transduction histidine kinase
MHSLLGGTKGDIEQLRILLVAQNPEDYQTLESVLGHIRLFSSRLEWSRTPDEGLRELSTKPYDICLLDQTIPEFPTPASPSPFSEKRNGVSCIHFIQSAIAAGCTAPIIVLSEGDSQESDVAALRAGAADYLMKGRIRPPFLERAIRYALERKKRREAVLQMEKQKMHSQKMKSLGELASRLTLDLSNALGAIVGHLDLIKLETSESESVQNSVEKALDSADRASVLIDHINAFTTPDTALEDNVNLQQVTIETTDLLRRILPTNIRIFTALHRGTDLRIHGNPALLRQILINIARNAEEAMPDGGTIQFSFSVDELSERQGLKPGKKAGTYIRMSIKDSGCGISSEQLDAVFDPTFTTQHPEEGLGLGLPLVYNGMECHQGWVEISSEIGTGTEIDLLFPVPAVEDVELPTLHQPETESKSSKGLILVIEDEAMIVELMKLYLEAAGFATQAFVAAREGVAWYTQNHEEVAMVILDMSMPEMSGKECFYELQKIDPNVQVALISGRNDEDVQELLKNGAIKFFQKPGRFPTMVTWIAEVLQRQQATQ